MVTETLVRARVARKEMQGGNSAPKDVLEGGNGQIKEPPG